ncbi:MAG: metal ABC transporter ATP-binding protein [Deltaproteobacteria bacterium]|nr:metal ABC transporter ATP-binding protein [Deltaproteobacteria bacterium]
MSNKDAGEAVVLEGVSVHQGDIHILEDLHAVVARGSITAIIGPNGAGKTTLLRAVLGLIPYRGRIRFPAFEDRGGPVFGYIPQRMEFDRGIPVTVLDFLTLSAQRAPIWMGRERQLEQKACSALARVEADQLLARPLGKLSGGEQQRVLLAGAIMHTPDILALDEPAAGVDVQGAELFCDLLESLRNEMDLTLMLVIHDLSIVTHHADHVICLNRTIRCQGTTLMCMTEETLKQTYGRHSEIYVHSGDNMRETVAHPKRLQGGSDG